LGGYWKVVNATRDATIVVLGDSAENILGRITFYNIDSRPVPMNLTDREKGLYLRAIKRDISYFSRSFRRAHISVDITGCGPDEASRKVREALTPAWQFRCDPFPSSVAQNRANQRRALPSAQSLKIF
jgi:shikimate kinase